MKKHFIYMLIFLISTISFSQTPYFQQHVDYKIYTQLFPDEAIIKSYETIIYTNNSPDTLAFIYFHLWPNAYKNKHTALAKNMAFNGKANLYFNAKKIGGYIDSLNFKTNNQTLNWEYDKDHIDICKVYLTEPLLPNKTVEISTPFVVKLPNDISRMGHKDSTFQLTQWYPKPAVYDMYGWHQMPYLNQGEFYSEFGNFEVHITVPKQQVVAATGNLNNESELDWLYKLHKTNSKGYQLNNPSNSDTKTLIYSENNIHDFAWFCSEKYYVSIDSVFTPNTNKKVTTWAFYLDDYYNAWQKGVDYVNAGVLYYSDWVGDYPYNNCTAVEGALSAGGGMEYPTITVISPSPMIEGVIVHEVGHNWFYGMLGFDERRYPMLDEGINTFYDHRYSYEIKNEMPYMGRNSTPENARKSVQLSYLINSFLDGDQPMDLHSSDYPKLNYGLIIYEKMPEALIYLEAYSGRSDFDSTMQAFFHNWKYKHPYPQDFENAFRNSSSTKNFDWFFNDFIPTNGKSDYSINYRNNNVIIKNKGNFTAPTYFVSFKDSLPVDTTWIEPFDGKIKIPVNKNDYSHFIIDPYFKTMDFNKYNNYAKTHGVVKPFDHFKIRMLPSIMEYNNRSISVTPFVFYNNISKFQTGVVITNLKMPPKNFTFMLMPLYSFGFKQLTGTAFAIYKHQGYNGLPGITYSFLMDRYTYRDNNNFYLPSGFRKITGKITFDLKNKYGSDKYSKKLCVSGSLYNERALIFNYSNEILNRFIPVYNVNFSVQKRSKHKPLLFIVNADIINDDYRLWTEFNYKIHYTSLTDGFEIRLFSGSNVTPTGSEGYSDYLTNHFFWSRNTYFTDENKSILAHQFVNNYGGLTYYYPMEYYDFVNAINIKTTLPKVPVIKFYYNLVSPANFTLGQGFDKLDFDAAMYEFGIMLDIIPQVMEIYFPLYGSQKLMDYNYQINDKWYSHFRFSFKLKNYNKMLNSL